MPDLYQLAARFRRDLLAGERTSATAMVKVYAVVYQRIQAEARALLDAIDAAEKVGDPANGLASCKRRLDALRKQVLAEIHTFAVYADQTIAEQQRQAVYSAGDHARQLVLAAAGGEDVFARAGVLIAFNHLPATALQHLAGTLQAGSPLRDLLDALGPLVAAGVEDALKSGLALGKNPKIISREIRRAAGMGLTRALTISRTEVLRSYRAASLASYQQNEDVVTGWRWTAAKSDRTCAMCLAMDGQEFPLTTPFGSHPNCRCSPVPVTKTYQEMGLDGPEPVPPPETGATWFARQPAETQRQILGPAKYDLYRRGEIGLDDLVDYRDDPAWGPTRNEKPLKDL